MPNRPGWKKVIPGSPGTWQHVASGWIVGVHLNRSSAFPFYGTDARATGVLMPSGWKPRGTSYFLFDGFATLAACQVHIEAHVRRLQS